MNQQQFGACMHTISYDTIKALNYGLDFTITPNQGANTNGFAAGAYDFVKSPQCRQKLSANNIQNTPFAQMPSCDRIADTWLM